MAQADEMGDEGEGHSDDGFVEGSEEVKKKKKKQGRCGLEVNTTS